METRLVAALQARLREYSTQDLACTKCKQVRHIYVGQTDSGGGGGQNTVPLLPDGAAAARCAPPVCKNRAVIGVEGRVCISRGYCGLVLPVVTNCGHSGVGPVLPLSLSPPPRPMDHPQPCDASRLFMVIAAHCCDLHTYIHAHAHTSHHITPHHITLHHR